MSKNTNTKLVAFTKPNTGTKPVGASVVQLSTSSRQLTNGVQILADPGNSGVVYVGSIPNVTAGTNNETDGFPLAAGASILFPARSEEDVYLIADGASQSVSFLSY